ncbi:hypothetical protein SLEP1_g10594 [Rubroshorea leprosula]|uniref:BZIP domain-containing protein n=1 Tax=Rubroshorea leprosula TaxID=152421 RepID=A0AAV5ID38_9ROSI|nr:hypothetical protein SLEP1_g10594 [Rubroshorea leprosula]
MQACEVSGLHYLAPSNPSPYSQHFSMSESNTPIFELINGFSNPLYNLCTPPQALEFNPQSSNVSNNSCNSDEADEQQQSVIINERKQRRKISNRESARRSRMRKQRHLDELWSQVVWLRNENHQLMDKLNHVSESHDRALQENVQLKEETSELRQMISNMHAQLSSPY